MVVLLNGNEFNELYKGHEFFKLLNDTSINKQNRLNYELNEDISNFDPCLYGGFYFTDKLNLATNIDISHIHMVKVQIPDDALILKCGTQFKTNKIIVNLNDKIKINDYIGWLDKNFCKLAVQQDSNTIHYIENPTEDMYMSVLSVNESYFKNIKNPSYKICKYAVIKNKKNIKYINQNIEYYDELIDIVNKQTNYIQFNNIFMYFNSFIYGSIVALGCYYLYK
jgi:hypothetical protein